MAYRWGCAAQQVTLLLSCASVRHTSVDQTNARCGRVLNEKVPTGNHASGFFSIPIERQDRQST